MRAREKRKLDKFERELAFMIENAADYPANSRGDRIAKKYAVLIPRIKTAAAGQVANPAQREQQIDAKEEDLEELKAIMKKLDRAGDILADEIPGIEHLFGLPLNRSEQSIMAAARAQYDLSEQYEAELLECGAPKEFRATMQNLINQIDAANQAADTAGELGAGATGGLHADMLELNNLSRSLGKLNKNILEEKPAKYAAWLMAAHLERDPKRTEEPQPPTT